MVCGGVEVKLYVFNVFTAAALGNEWSGLYHSHFTHLQTPVTNEWGRRTGLDVLEGKTNLSLSGGNRTTIPLDSVVG
jgi:hypothetical protein